MKPAAFAAIKKGLKESAKGMTLYRGSFAKFANTSSVLGYARKLGRKPRRTAAWVRELRAGEA